MEALTELTQALVELKKEDVLAMVEDQLEKKTPPLDLVKALNAAMIKVGERFAAGDYFISELIYSSYIMKDAMARLDPLFEQSDLGASGEKVVIGTVQGDIHDIGKSIVVTLIRNAGFNVIDLGVDVPAERFVEAIKDTGAKALALSCLLNLAISEMKHVVEALDAAGIRGDVKVIIGGQPIDEKVCEHVGADYYGPDAPAGVRICKQVYGQ
jgi:methylmalonyl-CoA mutase cobalamin-binding domain/chain